MKRKRLILPLCLALILVLSAFVIAEAARVSYAGQAQLDLLEKYISYPGSVTAEKALLSVSDLRAILKTTGAADVESYVLNKNTVKFHAPACDSVDTISGKYRIDYTGYRDTLISVGYAPCKNCNP